MKLIIKDNIPEFKVKLIRYLEEKISSNPEFILAVVSYAGQTEKEVDEMIAYMDSHDELTEADVTLYAIEISRKYNKSEYRYVPIRELIKQKLT